MNILEETKLILKKYKIEANKNLGQNFLISDEVVDGIIEAADITSNDLVIEIGPGLGVLTNRLLDNAYKVIAVELDERMVKIISERFILSKNLEIINQDILKVDLNKVIEDNKEQAESDGIEIGKVKIVANLPYYISTPIIMKLLEERLKIDSIIVMVQKEVADRLIAEPGTKNSGAITYAVDYFSQASDILKVEKECFIPSPKVESKVIKLEVRKEPKILVENEKILFDIIKKVFSQRRKTLVNVLLNYNIVESKEHAIKILKEIGLKEDVRGETLTLEQYETLCRKMVKL